MIASLTVLIPSKYKKRTDVPVTVEPAVTGHLEETAEVPALQARSVEVTSVTGELEAGVRAHWVS